MVLLHVLQLAGARQPVAHGVARPGMNIKLGDLGMRLGPPCRFEDLGALAHVVVVEQGHRRDNRGRREIRFEPVGFERCRAGAAWIGPGECFGLGGQKHGAAPVRDGALDLLCRFLRLDELQRSVPVATLRQFVDGRIGGPGKLGRGGGRAAGVMAGGIAVAEPLGLEIETAQAEQPHLGIVEHGLELGARRLVVALQQRGLGVEQVDQRLLVGADQLGGLLALPARQRRVAGAGGDHAGRQRLIAAIAPARPEMAGDGVGAVPDRLDQPPDDHHGGDDRHDGDGGHHEADLVLVAAEGDDHVTRPVGQPGEAEAEREDDEEEEQDADHVVLKPSSRWRSAHRSGTRHRAAP